MYARSAFAKASVKQLSDVMPDGLILAYFDIGSVGGKSEKNTRNFAKDDSSINVATYERSRYVPTINAHPTGMNVPSGSVKYNAKRNARGYAYAND